MPLLLPLLAFLFGSLMIAAGALVGPGKKIPAGVLVAGVPGRIVRELTDDDRASFADTSATYMAKAARHRAAIAVPQA